jgi:hypothetical protein
MQRFYWQWIKLETRPNGTKEIRIRMASLDGDAVDSVMTIEEAKMIHGSLGKRIAQAEGGAS